MAAGVRVFIWCVAVLATGAVSGTTGGALNWPLVLREGGVLGLEEGAARLPDDVISATTAVLRAVAAVPIDAAFEDHSGPMTQDSAQFARFQSAQTAAAALLANDTLEWVLADPHVVGMVLVRCSQRLARISHWMHCQPSSRKRRWLPQHGVLFPICDLSSDERFHLSLSLSLSLSRSLSLSL
eukprot:COSAG02_NODE_7675_length_2899_cov_3.344286_2_plen_183_part_00